MGLFPSSAETEIEVPSPSILVRLQNLHFSGNWSVRFTQNPNRGKVIG
jgi:hypothetical protein